MAAGPRRFLIALIAAIAGLFPLAAASAADNGVKIGVVIMHGKGGAPTKFVSDLAATLEGHGFLVANLEMPWSGRRDYDVTVGAAEREVEAALKSLRDKGAQKLFVAGHSQGGLFALYLGGKLALDGVIAIAPGGNVASSIYLEKAGESLASARKLVAEGRGDEKARLADFEASRGAYLVMANAAAYVTWFDPEGAMNQMKAARNMNPAVPVLYIVPTGDYPGLLRIKQLMFDPLPKNPRTRLYEPNSSHLNSPSASAREIIAWTTAIASAQ